MATATVTNPIPSQFAAVTLADYKTTGAAFIAALAACGLVQTSDTGQVNYSTVAAVPVGAGADWTIWQLNDSFQSTSPYFFKFWTFTSTTGGIGKGLCWSMQCATRTNGAGSLFGNVTGVFTMDQGSSNAPTTGNLTCYFSGDGSRIGIQWNPQAGAPIGSISTPQGFMNVERLLDSSGAYTDQGVSLYWDSKLNGKLSQIVFAEAVGALFPAGASAWTCAMPNSGRSNFGGNVGVFPLFPNIGYPWNPCLGVLGAWGIDIPTPGSSINLTMYGVSRPYIVAGSQGLSATGVNGNANIGIGLLLYQ